jgi:hypothetical protein
VVRKKLGLRLESEKTDGERVYRIVAGKASGDATPWAGSGPEASTPMARAAGGDQEEGPDRPAQQAKGDKHCLSHAVDRQCR